MADADLAGEADQDVQPERGDAEEADIDQQAELVAAQRSGAQATSAMPINSAIRLLRVGKIVVSSR